MRSEDIGFSEHGGPWANVEVYDDGETIISAGQIYQDSECHVCRLSREEALALLELLKRKLEG